MEKKTIGGFIAALRKANGMTQKDLAEKLNVSDKTVSRWERDDGAPDLSLIPVIAEIFDVTCDELLRGERKSPQERTETPENNETSPKAEKQRQRLLKSTLSKYKNCTCISVGISVIGIIAALICNFAFLRAQLGFFLGAAFFAAGIVCQAIFINKAFSGVEDAELDEKVLSDFKRKVIKSAKKSIGLTIGFIGFIFPLIFTEAYTGFEIGSMLLWGLISAAAFLLIYAVVLYFLNASLVKKGIYSLTEKESAVYQYNHKLKRKCAVVLAVLLAVTFGIFLAAIAITYNSMKGTTFEDYDSFIDYMEQNIPFDSSDAGTEPESLYPTDEEILQIELTDKNGKVVCTYIPRNENVIEVEYTPGEGTVLPITVYTYSEQDRAEQKVSVLHVIFAAAYCIECFAVVLFYFKKRKR